MNHGVKKLAIRCNASPFLGVGDLICGLIVARQARSRGLEALLVVDETPAALAVLARHDAPRRLLPPGMEPEHELPALRAILEEEGAGFLLVIRFDHHLGPYDRLKAELGLGLGCVDFWRNFGPGMDLVVNWDPGAESAYQGASHPGTRFLLGPGQVLLQDNVIQWAEREREQEPEAIGKALVAMGGSDWANLTLPALTALAELRPRPRVRAILGAATDQGDLGERARGLGLELEVLGNVDDMGRHLFWADLVLANGGLSLFECLALGRPALVTSSYPHQEPRCRAFAGQGAICYPGPAQEQDAASLTRALADLAPAEARRAMARRAKAAVGTRGASLLLDAMEGWLRRPGASSRRACA